MLRNSKIARKVFEFVWKRQLKDLKLITVLGLRTCRVDTKSGQRVRMQFLTPPWKGIFYQPQSCQISILNASTATRSLNSICQNTEIR
jgi:hypothetical protein